MDDRTAAYRSMFTRKSIQEALNSFDCKVDKSDFVYNCIQLALESSDLNVNNVVHEVLKRNKEN